MKKKKNRRVCVCIHFVHLNGKVQTRRSYREMKRRRGTAAVGLPTQSPPSHHITCPSRRLFAQHY